VDPKFPSSLTLIVRTVTDGDVEGSHLLPHVSQPRFQQNDLYFIKNLFLTYIVHSYEHDREHVAATEGLPQSLQPDWGIVYQLAHVCGSMPIRQRGPFHQVHRHCYQSR